MLLVSAQKLIFSTGVWSYPCWEFPFFPSCCF